MSMRTQQHFADVDDNEIKSKRQAQLKSQYLQGFKDGVESQREFCTDAVSREAVIGLYEKYRPSLATHVMEFGDALKALPTVTPERPKGEWIRVDNTKCKCSKCEVIHMIAQYPAGRIDWCPNCGADMREVSE